MGHFSGLSLIATGQAVFFLRRDVDIIEEAGFEAMWDEGGIGWWFNSGVQQYIIMIIMKNCVIGGNAGGHGHGCYFKMNKIKLLYQL